MKKLTILLLVLCLVLSGIPAAFATETEETAAEPEEEDTKVYPEGNPFAAEGDTRNTRRIDLSELKFGRNYGKD